MFEISGSLNGQTIDVKWAKGRVSGSPDALAALHNMALAPGGYSVGGVPGPRYTGAAILKSELGCFMACQERFDDLKLVAGKMPPLPGVPADAVA